MLLRIVVGSLLSCSCGLGFTENGGGGAGGVAPADDGGTDAGTAGSVTSGGSGGIAMGGAGGNSAGGGGAAGGGVGGGAGMDPVLVQTLSVPADGAQVTSAPLASGQSYLLRVSGTVMVTAQYHADAEYWGFVNNVTIEDLNPGATVDIGVAIDGGPAGPTKQPHWGSYQSSHEYEHALVGSGASITARYYDGDFSNNSGALTLEIFALP